MDVMSRRREILASDSGGYIRDGLVLWMDGIEKGTTSGAWTDRVAGHVFTAVNGFTDGVNYVGLNAASSQYLRNTTFNNINTYTGTIEVAISDYTKGSIIFMPKSKECIAFGVRASNMEIISSVETNYPRMTVYPSGAKLFSIVNNTLSLVNGVVASTSSNNAWDSNDGTYTYIGCRNKNGGSNYATAKIYAIRIYNRILTQAEMLHNQRIDNKRFGLGLTI